MNGFRLSAQEGQKLTRQGVNMLKKIVCSLVLASLNVTAAGGQDTADAIKKLTGGGEKTWVYSRLVPYLGGKTKCKSGESWTFHRDNRVEIKRCEKGATVTEGGRWSISAKTAIDIVLKVKDVEYLLLFPKPKPPSNKETMILRLKSMEKTMATKDLIFYYEVD